MLTFLDLTLKILDRAFEHFIFPLLNPLDRGPDFNIWHKTNAPKLPPIYIPDSLTGETNDNFTQHNQVRYIAFGPCRVAANSLFDPILGGFIVTALDNLRFSLYTGERI